MFRTIAVTLLLSASLGACARPATTTSTAPRPAPAEVPVVRPPVTVTPEPLQSEADTARADWQRLDADVDGVIGTGSERALAELLAGRTPGRQVVVAVIDGGVDTLHRFLTPVLWHNSREVAGNGADDDGNGFVDDTFGWNFAVTANGEAVNHDTFEVTRLYAACNGQPAGKGVERPAAAKCDTVAAAYRKQSQKINRTLMQIESMDKTFRQISTMLDEAIGEAPLTKATVKAFRPADSRLGQAQSIWLQLAENGINDEMLTEAREAYESQARYGLDTLFQPHTEARDGGSGDVMGPDAKHGTHVAGIIGAVRGAGNPVQGIAPGVRIMAGRAVPDGDERDADVARAVRYAADNGAQIINMSFGKAWSPGKEAVDSAMRYAANKGVLLVHAAGNDAEDNDSIPSFPNRRETDGSRIATWIEVGASSWKGTDMLATNFSNYGRTTVDLFAPGEDILSTVPGGGVKRESGTSMAAPVVSGVAALLMAYFPTLSALEVKDILLHSVRTFPDQLVARPGDSGERVPFSSLSSTGGIVDAYAAVKLALSRAK